MAVLTNTMLQGTSADTGDTAYQIKKSLRCKSDDVGYLLHRPTAQGNRRIWTWAGWLKRTRPGVIQRFFGTDGSDTWSNDDLVDCRFEADDRLTVAVSSTQWRVTTQKFRDPCAWLHFLVAVDTTLADADGRVKIWINGRWVTTFDTKNNPAQHALTGPGRPVAYHRVGAGYTTSNSTWEGYMADVHFIDGLALSPAAFGSFDSTGVFNPKAFALPAPNKGVTHSNTLTCTIDGSSASFNSGNPATKAFDGNATDGSQVWANVLSTGSGQVVKMTYTPATAISAPTTLRIHTYTGDSGDPVYVTFNGNGRTRSLLDLGYSTGQSQWVDVYDLLPKGEDITSITVDRTSNSAGDGSPIGAIEIDGSILIDGKIDPTTRNNVNRGLIWRTNGTVSGNSTDSGKTFDRLFNGNLSEYAEQSGNDVTLTWTPAETITVKKSMRIYFLVEGNPNDTVINGDATAINVDPQSGWTNVAVPSGGMTFSKLEMKRGGSGVYARASAIEIDGNILIDSSDDNSFHLKFEDKSRSYSIGKNSFSRTVATATGGLPFYNTSGADGEAKGSGYRTDSAAGTTDGTGLIFALPGDVLTDEHDHVNTGSSAVTVTNSGAVVSTSQSRFYGSSIAFDGSNDYLTVAGSSDFAFGTGDFTIEFWLYSNELNPNNKDVFANPGGIQIFFVNGKLRYNHATVASLLDTDNVIPPDQWVHCALVRNSATTRWYINGLQNAGSYSDTKDWTQTTSWYVGSYNGSSQYSNIFLNDLRVYKGHAKHNTSFKVPIRKDFAVYNLATSSSYISWPLTTTGTFEGSRGADKAFNGEVNGTDYAHAASGQTCTISFTAVTGITKLRLNIAKNSGGDNWGTIELNDTDDITSWLQSNYAGVAGTAQWIDVTSQLTGTSLSKLEFSTSGNNDIRIAGVEVNDEILLDPKKEDLFVDSPTNYGEDAGNGGEVRGNFCILNSLNSSMTGVTKGGTDYYNQTGAFKELAGSIAVNSGKWYYEVECYGGDGGGNSSVGWAYKTNVDTSAQTGPGSVDYAVMFENAGWDQNFSTSKTNRSITVNEGDILGVSIDLDAGTPFMRTWVNNGSQNTINLGGSWSAGKFLFPYVNSSHTGGRWRNFNFGQRPWMKTCPSGYKALCTQNLDDTFTGEDLLNNPSKFFEVKNWNGTGAEKDIKGFAFQPDLAWIKNRDSTNGQMFTDAVRGATKVMYGHLNWDEDTEAQSIKSFLSDGYKIGTFANNNTNTHNYTSWNWDAGTSAATPSSSYNITPTGQWVNPTASFSITGYTGNGTANQTIPHGLSVAPDLIIVKGRSFDINWPVYHSSLASGKGLFLDLDNKANTWVGGADNVDNGGIQSVNNNTWTTAVGASTDNNVNKSGETYISYAWSAISGYSAFGSYTGNGNAFGPFIFTGMRPAYVLWKRTDTADNWAVIDTARSPFNVADDWLGPNKHDAESANNAAYAIDILSNGFKVRATHAATNVLNGTYIYAAFAEHPFKTARAK